MPLRVKSGAGWSAPVANGALRLKWGGTTWLAPSYARIKIGDVGGGYWYDTGYRGPPNAPTGLAVYGWDFSNVSLYWSAPSGGGPVTSYELLQTDSAGNGIRHVTGIGGSPWGNFAVGQDGRYRFWVRAKGVGEQYSAWVEGPPIGDGRLYSRVQIGHTEAGYYANENRTRGWTSGQASGARHKDQGFAVYAPNANFVVQSLHWRNIRTQQGNIIAPQHNEWGPMTIYWVVNGALQSPITDYFGHIWSGDNRDWWISNGVAATNWFGLYPEGSGWSTWDDPAHMLYADAVWVQGYENYSVSVYYMTRAYAGNNYW